MGCEIIFPPVSTIRLVIAAEDFARSLSRNALPATSKASRKELLMASHFTAPTDNNLSVNESDCVRSAQLRKEQRLVAAAKCGDRAAVDELLEPLAKRTFRIVYRITKNREDAEDALQNSFLNAFVHIKDFDGRSRFSTWLTCIAINSALTILRKRRNSYEIPSDCTGTTKPTDHNLETLDRASNPEKHYLQKERERILRRAIRALRPPARTVVELQKLQDHSVAETARIIGLTVATVKTRLFHARAALRKDSGLKTIARTPNSESKDRMSTTI